ncbi:hypothetical protein GV794_01385 [Nocardia cyriacigeorgica]|uniref:Uncharacterized protein n=1 Tax=Nocardia cyriacigeorgica TaxID=135487 RepID=A0A6P1D5A1_9NOCA|nr:hypothetical protein [Nocardia cyriacigeorgica]NEW40680.1 hypothetical protein [Nocardia cyriacigeorgica]NEW44073.1 hypothetical protein [Nocardia cyriacigeorgica]NEW54325.1 hypothetical protein [Nocardia cyriacigeorgica]
MAEESSGDETPSVDDYVATGDEVAAGGAASGEEAASFVDFLDIANRIMGEGEPAGMEEISLLPTVPSPASSESNFAAYMGAAESFRLRADALNEYAQKQKDVADEAKENVTKFGRSHIRDVIVRVNTQVMQATDGPTFIEHVGLSLEAVDAVRAAVQEKSQELGNTSRDLVAKLQKETQEALKKQSEAQAKALKDALAKFGGPGQTGPGNTGPYGPGTFGPGTTGPGVNGPGTIQNPPPWVNDNGPKQPGTTPDINRPGTITPPGTSPGDTKPPTSGIKPPISDIKPPTTTPPISTPPRTNPPISSPSSGLGGMPGMGMPGMGMPGMGMPGMGMPGMGMPGMYNDQMARRNELDRDLARRRDEMDPHRDKPRDVVPPRSAVQQAVAQPNGANPGANAQHVNANPNVSAAPGAGTPPPGGQVPGPVPNADGKVPFDFPGRPTLMVSPVAHTGMGAAVANKKGTDAKAAYKDTPAKWNDDKKIGLRTDPDKLVAGDVVSWKDTTAIVVVWPKGEGGADAAPVSTGDGALAGGKDGPLEIIANGELQQVTDDMMKDDGPYGAFNGFFHPNAIDAVPPADAGAGGGAPVPVDQQPTVVA